MTNKILIFDFDGTIADSRDLILKTVNELSRKYGFKSVENIDIEKLRGKTIKELFSILGISWIKLPLLVSEYRKNFNNAIYSLKLIAGIKEVLVKLHNSGYKLAIVSSNSKENIEDFFNKNNISLFDYIQTGSSLFGKSRILEKLIKKNNLDKKDIYYIGDEVRDIEAAKNAGIKMIAVTWGFQSKEVFEKYQPDFIVNTSKELFNIFFP